MFNVVQLLNSASAPGSGDRRHGISKATAFAKGAGSPPPRPPNDTWQTLKMGRAPPGAMFVFKVLPPAHCGRRPNPHREVRHPSQTGDSGVRGGSTTTGETGEPPTRRRAAPDTPRCELLPCQSCWRPERPYLTVCSVAVLARSRSRSRAERCS